jgi:hypothetical protein
MTEQLAFKQSLGNRRAIDGNKRIGGTAAGGVNSARKELLAGARLPDEEDGDRTAGSDLRSEVYRVAKSAALTDDMSVPTLFWGF